jgi:hypothetical protein
LLLLLLCIFIFFNFDNFKKSRAVLSSVYCGCRLPLFCAYFAHSIVAALLTKQWCYISLCTTTVPLTNGRIGLPRLGADYATGAPFVGDPQQRGGTLSVMAWLQLQNTYCKTYPSSLCFCSRKTFRHVSCLIYSAGLKLWNIHLNNRVFHMIREKQKSCKSHVKGFAVSILMFEFLLHQILLNWWRKCVELSLS